MKIDFFKNFHLVKPFTGLVYQITSPKGIRSSDPEKPKYKLKTKLISIYKGEAIEIVPGVYDVLDTCKIEGKLRWNHYLFYVTENEAFPIAEFLDVKSEDWVIDAIPIIKKAMKENVTRIKLTKFRPEKKRRRWDDGIHS